MSSLLDKHRERDARLPVKDVVPCPAYLAVLRKGPNPQTSFPATISAAILGPGTVLTGWFSGYTLNPKPETLKPETRRLLNSKTLTL